jgi:transcriptional regulator with XRE-family HTH domain
MVDARDRLREWIQRSRMTQREAAELLEMHYTFLSQILNSDRSPSLTTAVRIEQVTGIPCESWVSTDVDNRREASGARGEKRRIDKE